MKRALALPVLLLALAATPADDPPPARLPLGRDTTFVFGPLDKHGFIDYENALNAEMSRGVTADNNANVLLMRAFGPKPEGAEMPLAYYRWLGMDPPPENGDYLIDLYKYTTRVIQLPESQREALYEFQSRAGKRPWVVKDCPPLAEWIKGNEKPLALVHEAVKRDRYFNPLCSRRAEGEPSNLIGTLLPNVQKCREFAALLSARAGLHLGDGRFEEAWADIVACHRLGRHVAHGATLIEHLVGVAITQIASQATYAYLDRAPLTAEQARAKLKELRALPAFPSLATKIGVAERMMGLDVVQMARRGPQNLNWIRGVIDADREFTDDEKKAYSKIDWTVTLQTMNKWYDRNAETVAMADRAARQKALDASEKELADLKSLFGKPETLKKLLEAKDAERAFGKAFGEFLMTNLAPAYNKVMQAHDRALQNARTLEVALALAAHKADTGGYPDKLDALAPKYLAAVPGDLFSGKALVYKRTEKGYTFYSVGVNGKDDNGQTYGDDPPGDDLGLALPLPELKK